MTLKEFNDSYVYTSDVIRYKRIEHWTEMKEDSEGNMRGDCEDYAITVKRQVKDDKWKFADWSYYWCTLNGEGHCILVSDCGLYLIDNNVKRVVTFSEYFSIYEVNNLKKYNKLQLFNKFVTLKIVNWFKAIFN